MLGTPQSLIRIGIIQMILKSCPKTYLALLPLLNMETKEAMLKLYNDFSYVGRPSRAVWVLGLKNSNQETIRMTFGIFLELHNDPWKFLGLL